MDVLITELPWPPSVNTYWRRKGNTYYVSNKALAYRKTCSALLIPYRGMLPRDARYALHIDAYPPDKVRRDLDNLPKGILDSLQHAGIYEDDYQIDKLSILRHPPKPKFGLIKITLYTC